MTINEILDHEMETTIDNDTVRCLYCGEVETECICFDEETTGK
jgi:hypothetical protein